MKQAISLTSLLTIALAVGVQAASAQEGRPQARFNFAPNIWKTEQARVPVDHTPEPFHTVRNGSMPGKNLLGVDPQMFAPRPAPALIPVQTVAARPVATSTTPQMMVPKTSFNPAFGKPQIAQLPAPMPQQAVAQPMIMPTKPAAASHAPAAGRRAPVIKRHFNTQVAGRLLKPARIAPTHASPEVASYGKNFGYVPGPILPSTNIGSLSAQSEVRGKLIRHK